MKPLVPLLLLPALIGLFPSAPVQNSPYDRWVKTYEVGEKGNEKTLMLKAIKDEPQFAAEFCMDLCWKMVANAKQFGVVNKERMTKLKEAFQEALGCNTAQLAEDFFTGLDTTKKQELAPLIHGFNNMYALLDKAGSSKKEEDFVEAMLFTDKYAKELEELGYYFKAAEACTVAADILNKNPKRNLDDRKRALEYAETFKKLRDEWEWTKDKTYTSWVNFITSEKQKLAATREEKPKDADKPVEAGKPGDKAPEGAKPGDKTKEPGKDAAKAEGKAPTNEPKPLKPGEWERVPLKGVVDRNEYEGYSSWSSGYPLSWHLGGLNESGSPNKLDFFKDAELYLARPKANTFLVADNAKGEKGTEVKVKSKPEVSEFKYKKGDKTVTYAMWLYAGSDQESHLRLQLNVAPQWDPGQKKFSATIFFRGAMSYAGSWKGTPIVCYDETGDGLISDDIDGSGFDPRFGDGLSPGKENQSHPRMDAMSIAGTRMPYSTFARIGGAWYRLRVNGNEEVALQVLDPASVEPGTVQFKWHGPAQAKPKRLLIREVANFKGGLFDIGATDKTPLEVPAGSYEVCYGRTLVNGKGVGERSFSIMKGASKVFYVEKGKNTLIELGAPFQIEYEPKKAGGKVTVDATEMFVRGRSGERYCMFNDEILEPEILVAADQNGKGHKVASKFRRAANDDLDALYKSHPGLGLFFLYYPVWAEKKGKEATFKATVDVPGTGFVGLQQKGHKWFGDLTPIWK